MSTTLTQGANAPLPASGTVTVTLGWAPARPQGSDVDAAAFILGADGRVRGDADMVFYNQPASADGALRITGNRDGQITFSFEAARADPAVDRIALTLTLGTPGLRFAALTQVTMTVQAGGTALAQYDAAPGGRQEAALIVAELYRRQGHWKIRAVGQGFNGGLAPLARSFGVDVAESAPATAAPPAPPPPPPPAASPPAAPPAPPPPPGGAASPRLSLEKRLVALEKTDQPLVSLAKRARVVLDKMPPLAVERARVVLALDISGSMAELFRAGAVDHLVQRLIAFALNFDDDGDIDVFLFGASAHDYGTVSATDYRSFVPDMLRRHRLEGGTYYGKVMKLIRQRMALNPDWGRVPIYVLFVTDGGTQDVRLSEQMIIEASREGMFWQFVAIGEYETGLTTSLKRRRRLPNGFEFLDYLDRMEGRLIDNASFFTVRDPREPTDEQMFEMLMEEYPGWIQMALDAGVLRR